MGRPAGRFNKRLQILAVGNTGNGSARHQRWTATGTYVWCEVLLSGSARQEVYGSLQTVQTATINVRGLPSLSGNDRLSDGSTVWQIESLVRDEDNQQTVCECETRLSGIGGQLNT